MLWAFREIARAATFAANPPKFTLPDAALNGPDDAYPPRAFWAFPCCFVQELKAIDPLEDPVFVPPDAAFPFAAEIVPVAPADPAAPVEKELTIVLLTSTEVIVILPAVAATPLWTDFTNEERPEDAAVKFEIPI
jgi:hypothetical protein